MPPSHLEGERRKGNNGTHREQWNTQSNTKWQCHTTASLPLQGHSHSAETPERSQIMPASKTRCKELRTKKAVALQMQKMGPNCSSRSNSMYHKVTCKEWQYINEYENPLKSRPGCTSQKRAISRSILPKNMAESHAHICSGMAECSIVKVLLWGASIFYLFSLIMSQWHAAGHTFTWSKELCRLWENPSHISGPSIFAQESQAVQGSSAAHALMYQGNK